MEGDPALAERGLGRLKGEKGVMVQSEWSGARPTSKASNTNVRGELMICRWILYENRVEKTPMRLILSFIDTSRSPGSNDASKVPGSELFWCPRRVLSSLAGPPLAGGWPQTRIPRRAALPPSPLPPAHHTDRCTAVCLSRKFLDMPFNHMYIAR